MIIIYKIDLDLFYKFKSMTKMENEGIVNFDSLNMKISELIKKYPIEEQKEIFEYLSHMDDHNKNAYNIAYSHLGTSFNIVRSNGFKEWKKEKSSAK